ncbi:hypothetical protein DOY81_003149 [Sarcophaga bullata]|nr:hypothetical protein DOY81_003149 [Sarcophaga bullata]
MSKSSTEQFQIKKKRKHPLSISTTAPLKKPYKRHINSVSSSSLSSSTAAAAEATADLLIKENYTEYQIDNKESTKFNTLLQIKSLAGAVAAAAAAATAAATLDNLSEVKKCIITSTAATTTAIAKPKPIVAVKKNCLRDQSQVLILNTSVNMPLSHEFYVKGALATKRGLKALKTNATSGSPSVAAYEDAKRPRWSNENLKLQSPCLTTQQKTTNNLQLSYMLGESLARHGRLQEAFDIYALIASEQPEGFIPLEKLNILATALLEYIRILSSSSKKPSDIIDAESIKTLNSEQQKLVTPIRSKYASSTTSGVLNWSMPSTGLHKQSSKLKDLDANFLASAVGGNLDLHSPTRELAGGNNGSNVEDYDPLMCPLCRDVLRCPVTTNCGHTFCRQCCETITMCNICHIKFPRWQKDDSCSSSNNNFNIGNNNKLQNFSTTLASLSTATTTTTTTSMDLSTTHSNLSFNNHQQMYSSISPFTTSLSSFNSSTSMSSSSSSSSPSPSSSTASSSSTSLATINEMPRLQIITTPFPPSPTTVTTTTIACTTDTATTTMASTSAISGGVALRSSSSNDNIKFMPDVLVRRLVEKWWGADLKVKKINETATSYMHLNLLDDALKFCNASLEKSPTNFKSLLLRAEVLRKMNHYQSSLADVDNALKTRYTSAKAHYLRALALSDLSRYEEALYETCLAIGMDKSSNLSNTELFQHDLTKILQKLLSQTPKCLKLDLSSLRSKAPYSIYSDQRLRRKNMSVLNSNAVQDDDPLNLYEDDDFLSANYGKDCVILTDEDVLACSDFLNCGDKRTTYASIAKKYELELKRQTTRKHFRRKWMQNETELLPPIDVESARCSSQFRNVLERMQQEIVRLKKIESSPEYLQRQLVAVNPSLIDASDFDCVLCCRTFWKPVITPCGHTYCLVCLDRCMDYTSSCPLCMSPLVEPSLNMYQGASSPVPLMLTKRPVTKFLEAAMKRFIPDSYNKRFRQEMVLEPSVPIFICTTAFPYVPCPLFVYEPRYRLMVRRAVESGEKQFGIVQPHSGKSRYYDYGCILDIRDCVLLGDGCSILSTIGCKRFKILARSEKDGYETAKVEYIHDETIPDEHLTYVSNMHDVVLSKAILWYQSLGEDLKHEILQSYGEMPLVEDNWETIADGPAWAWWIIALLPLRPQLKVDILATTSLEKRLRAIEKTIHSMPGNYHYQTVSQNCDVAVVVHNQQLHTHGTDVEENEVDVHHMHHHVVDDEDDLSRNSVDDEDEEVDHIQNETIEQQHAAHMPLEQQQQMLQHQCDNSTTGDECCQRTNAVAYEHEQLHIAEETHSQHHQHHQQRHHRNGHAHSLLL